MTKTQKILGWITAVLACLPLAGSAIPKLFLAKPGTEFYANFEKMGFHEILIPLGIIDLLLPILLLVPRFSALGAIAVFGYWSGAFATELTHGQFNPAPVLGILFVILSAWFRSPELFDRILGRKSAA